MSQAIKKLEELQEEAYTRLRLSPSKINKVFYDSTEDVFDDLLKQQKGIMTDEAIQKVRKELIELQLARKKIKLPTKYEVLTDYSLILSHAELIEKAIPYLGFMDQTTGINYSLKDLNMNIVRPTFGTLPYGDLNAMAYSFDNGEYLIIFESELLQFCNLITKIVARSFPYEEKDGKIIYQFTEQTVLSKLESDEVILGRFQDLLINYLITGYATAAKQYYLEGAYLDLHAHLLESMETFIMGHEYSHILLRHIGSDQPQKNLTNAEKFKMTYSWPEEYEADGLGLPLMLIGLRFIGKQNDFISYCGAELFFSAYEIIQRGACILKTGNDNFYLRSDSSDGLLGSHPPPDMRRENLRKLMKNNYGDKSIETSLIVEKIIKALWEKTKPYLIENHNELYKKFLSYKVETNAIQEKYSDVFDSLDKILELDNQHLPALFGKGNIFQKLGRFTDANQYYDSILQIDKDNIGAIVQKANVSFRKKEYKESLELANNALKKDSRNQHALFAKGMALDHLDQFDEAIECFNLILKLDKNNIPALLRIAFAYSMKNDPETAIIYYDKILEIKPAHPDAIIAKLTLLEYLKKYDDAIKIIDNLLKDTPDDVNLLEVKNEFEQMKMELGNSPI